MMILLFVAAVVLAGCAKPPQMEIDAAKAALDASRASAAEYAASSLSAAEDALNQLNAELKAQEDKFALFRNYDKAKELSMAAKAAAEKAAADAEAAKEAVRAETVSLLESAKTSLTEVTEMIAKAPRGKGSAADLTVLKADVDAAAATFAEIEAALAEGRYLDAQAKARAANDTIARVRSEIEQAMQLAGGRR
jgi:predicted DNA-binding protein YlxM (UPF0122 family)